MEETLHKVWIGHDDGENVSAFIEMAQTILLPVLGRDVVIHSYRHAGNRRPIRDDGNFHVWLWTSASGDHYAGNEFRSSVLFGLSMGSNGWNWYGPSGQGVKFSAPENELTVVAELMDGNLYIFPPINDGQLFDVGPKIFGHILEMVVTSGELGGPVLPEDRVARMREINKTSFIRSCGSRLAHNVSVTEAAVQKKTGHLEECRTQLLNRCCQLKLARDKLRQPGTPVDGEKFGKEFDGLLRVPKVRRVVTNGHKVEVYTDMIYCRDPRSKTLHELGKFRIVVDIFAGNVLWFNTTRRINGHKKAMHAPHVFDGGVACLGSAAEIFAELFTNFEIAATVMYAIQFVESVNVDDDSGQYVNRWPVAANQGAA